MKRFVALAAALLTFSSVAWANTDALYQEYCAECHGAERLGGVGPALIPEALGRMRGPKIVDVILNGRPSSEMMGFGDQISPAQAEELAEYLKVPLEVVPDWPVAEIDATRVVNENYAAVDAPVFKADPLNLILIEEMADHSFSIVDGDSIEVIHRFEAPFAVHGSPKFSADGRFVYVMSRDGWVQKYDIWGLQEVVRVRAGLNSRNIALSHDGKWLAVANYLPNTLSILSADDLSAAIVHEIKGKDGSPSRVSAVYTAAPRESFVLALKDVPETWEVFYGENPPFHGFVHDYRIEGPPEERVPFPRRRMMVGGVIDDFIFDESFEYALGAKAGGDGGAVVDLVIGHKIADLDLPGLPRLGSAVMVDYQGRRVMVTPHLRADTFSVVDMKTWETVKRIETGGPGFFMRDHAGSPYLWGDVFFGPNKDKMHVLDRETLEIVKTLQPVPGAALGHIEFTRDGKFALVSVWEEDGAVIVYDATTLEEVRRLEMRKPLGKYNIGNKIGG